MANDAPKADELLGGGSSARRERKF